MGYDLHITRRKQWFDDSPSITLDEWLNFVEEQSDIRHDGFAEATTPSGDVIRMDEAGLSVWTGYSGDGFDGNHAWFRHHNDNITVQNPDEEVRRKMYQIAQHFGGGVQGDEGEHYGSDGEPVDVELVGQREKSPWWKFW